VRDIELSRQQKIFLTRNSGFGQLKAAKRNRERASLKRTVFQEEGRIKAKEKEYLHAVGCMLYWGEGTKGRNTVAFANSDPNMIVLFKSFLDAYFSLGNSNYSIRCKLYTDIHSQEDIEEYWLKVLKLPRSCLRASTVNYYARHSKDKRRGMLEYGCCTLVVHNTQIVQHIFGAIQEYGGFKNDKWLD
jgi:hypothetical protein